MTIISLIAAMDEAGGIGRNNQLLCHLPADLQHFKAITLGKSILMGRNTYESIGKPLPGRLNIVISNTMQAQEGIVVVDSIEKALKQEQDSSEVMIIGGSTIYAQTISRAERLYITVIHHAFEADVFFPKIDKEIWRCSSSEFRPKDEKNTYDMTFCMYEKQ
jgi:dihydrofolate reductase